MFGTNGDHISHGAHAVCRRLTTLAGDDIPSDESTGRPTAQATAAVGSTWTALHTSDSGAYARGCTGRPAHAALRQRAASVTAPFVTRVTRGPAASTASASSGHDSYRCEVSALLQERLYGPECDEWLPLRKLTCDDLTAEFDARTAERSRVRAVATTRTQAKTGGGWRARCAEGPWVLCMEGNGI